MYKKHVISRIKENTFPAGSRSKMLKVHCMVSTSIGQYSFIAVSRTHETGMSNICFIGLQFSVYAHGTYQKFDTAQFPGHFLRKVFNKLCQYMQRR